MTAGWSLARAELRARPWSALVIAVAGGLALGLALAGVAGARRGPAAWDDLVARFRASDFSVFPQDPERLDELEQTLAGSDAVAATSRSAFVLLGAVEADGTISDRGVAAGMVDIAGDRSVERPAVVRGRLPETAFEVAVNDAVARRRHVEPGDTIRLAVFGADQVDGVGRTSDPPAHGQFDFTVTGIVRQPGDLEFQAEAQPGTVYERDDEMHWYSAALWSRFDGDIANYGTGAFARLRPGADTEALADELRTVDRNAVVDDEHDSADIFTTIARTIDVQSAALLAFAVAVAIVAGAALATAIVRQAASATFSSRTIVAIGAGPRTVAAAAAVWAAIVGGLTAVVAAITAFFLSWFAPLGVARAADLTRGFDVDVLVLLGGAVVITAATVALGMVAARHATRRPRAANGHRYRPFFVAVAPRSAGPTIVTGASLVDPGTRGAGRLPSRSALAAVAAGTAAVVAALTFGASLDRVTTSPAAYGWSWDVQVANCSDNECAAESARLLAADPDVAAWTGQTETTTTLDGRAVELAIVTTEGGWSAGAIEHGRPPRRDDEIVVATETLAAMDAAIGDRVTVDAQGTVGHFTIVGVYVPPAMLSDGQSLTDGAAVTRGAVRRIAGDEMYDAASPSLFMVSLDPRVDRDVAIARLEHDFPGTVARPYRTDDVESAYRMRALPFALALLVAGIGAATLVHLGALTVRRRREMFATLVALGYQRRQVRATLVWQMLIVVAASLATAIPAGIVVGRIGWKTAASALDVHASIVVPFAALGAAVAILAIVATLIGAIAGNIATRRPAAVALRR